ncbi:integrase arm-type DNA-binding domain-containing protein [Sinorhizobium numidicum]|uniref:Integrase arm-type DNA-binding domain-containing protein n=1 Tax=Sinorhizobium numidicum TaxID=680248 RepID=A0ABY8CUH7_9HYPH|nr:integrase arm-type DNA-binding domain-containing protein [Sinorhizobium numidicum]WEX78406.1 integrase arm-type DNA-binding domain-containing protein [Sinorhizobium numidicum]WEX81802.1 integrase arm-type DNA-binding domain-containing protein [Sinorhizobium numidicum]
MSALADKQVKNAKKAESTYKLADGGGLNLFVLPTGTKSWRLRYRFDGKEKTLVIGNYPDVSLADARAERESAKETLKAGRDPNVVKKVEKLVGKKQTADTFEVIAREWHELQKPVEKHASDVLDSLVKDVFPIIGKMPIRDIDAPTVLAVLRIVENRDAKETARRIRQRLSSIFVYAIASGRATQDPAGVVREAMAPMKKGRQLAITDVDKAREMLQAPRSTPSHPVTKLGLRLLVLTAVRPGTLITTPWGEWNNLDEDDPIWQIPAARMKLKLQHKDDDARDHLVPLSRQAMETIAVLRSITGRGPFALPNGRHAHKAMSENALGYLLNRAGYHHKHVPHGFRSTFSTIMNERYPADRQIFDLMLAHTPRIRLRGLTIAPNTWPDAKSSLSFGPI